MKTELSPIATVNSDIRYHSLDGVRASMMLLGIFFHVAWFFMPVYFWHPITDASANWGFSYFFYWVHVFRMQTFFLVAGFFACLLVYKRGLLKFVGNRLQRVAVPFVVFTALLYPVMNYQSILGGIESGRIQTSESAWGVLVDQLRAQELSQLRPLHFWFLEFLLILYGISLALLLLSRHVFDRSGRVRQMLQTAFASVVSSPVGVLVVALPVATSLYWAITWYGITPGPLKPFGTGVFAYWIFFAFGWCLYKQPELLRRIGHGWQWKLIAGTALSVALCMYCNTLLKTGRLQWGYPIMNGGQICDYAHFRHSLLAAGSNADATPAGVVWSSLSPEYQKFIERTTTPTSDQLAGIAMEISLKVFTNAELADAKLCSGLPLEEPWKSELAKPAAARSPEMGMDLNRKIVEAALAPAIVPRWIGPAWVRAAYFFGYAFSSWLLVFGTIGFFSRVLTQASPAVRYIADSSYWLYIIHLPIQFQIQLWLAPIEMHWLLKYIVYMAITFAVMIPTYHYLVRSTWLGVLLNGRRYELVPLFRRAKRPQLKEDPVAILEGLPSKSHFVEPHRVPSKNALPSPAEPQ
jgi:peptidoglycan/LPS O-acetylase OafA/YrhL